MPVFQHQKFELGGCFSKLRIGYLSWDFADHPLAHLLQSIFGMHNKNKFQAIGFSLRKSDNSSYR